MLWKAKDNGLSKLVLRFFTTFCAAAILERVNNTLCALAHKLTARQAVIGQINTDLWSCGPR